MTILRRTTGDDCTFTALPVRALLLQVLFILLVHVPTTAAGSYSGGRSFLLRMFWTDGYEWQSSTSEKYWCATCSSDYCDEYDTIEVQKCDADDAAQQWQYVEVSGSKNRGLIKTMGRDLCIQAHSTNGRNFHLRQCDDDNSDQILQGFEYGGSKFELTTKNDDDDRCITQHHHPRIGEELRMQECERARKTKTSYWVTYKESRGGRPSLASYGRDGCDDDYPCDKCTGDCDDNSNCMGNLKCFQRSGRQDVPGCSGDGVSGDDYCYDPADDDDDDNDDDDDDDDHYYDYDAYPRLKEEHEDPSYKLDVCEGDCDDDNDCRGHLVCFQRDGYADVPGCSGSGDRDWDYCAFPELEEGSSGSKLGVCQGDCDDDSDCKGDLVCFERDGYEDVPGCNGRGDKDWDYCVDDH
mmetsp:Transcript_26813/g.58154  ORF Transcript_26813/g.58154 Transcript_26813/m.58154 type:complete len:409 (+) Transcript_26813:97-1323(+)